MEVILLEKIRNLGNLGDKVDVKPGFGRNFLLPYKKAVSATPENIKRFEKERAEHEKKAQQLLAEAEKRAEELRAASIILSAMASDEGKLYGSVGPNEIKEALQNKFIEVSKREIVMPEGPIHSVGDFPIEIHLHSDVVVTLQVQIVSAK